ncbi:TPA: prepilin peptidase, partial [Candidatus Woesearchaeota archaeon]|nr:prepilin peptidase [Candidatus Woesearchaeota archaeon]
TVLVVLIAGTYCDFRWREVPDWVNYGLILAGVGFRLITTIITKDYTFLLYGLYGFIAAFLIAILMFYTGQWGGGDSKMIMGIGAMAGLSLSIDAFFIGFLVNTLIFGALFGLAFSVYLVATHWSAFRKDFRRLYKEKRKRKYFVWALTAALLLVSVFSPWIIKMPLVVIAGLLFISFYTFIYLKAVEKSCMLKYVSPEELTEGDWIAEPIHVGKKYIAGPKDLGIELEQIAQLKAYKKKKLIDKVLIKVGVPFVPSFLIAFVVQYLWGNVVLRMLGL